MNILELRETIVSSSARAIFVQWWAAQCACGLDYEHCRLEGDGDPDWNPDDHHEPNDPGGVELMDYAPDTTPEASACAERFIAMVEGRQEMAIATLLARVLGDDGFNPAYETIRDDEASDFGHYLAMSALGHGVDWDDHYPTPKGSVRGPEIGFYGNYWDVCARLTSTLIRGKEASDGH